MSTLEERFNRSGFSRFINSPAGRVFRLATGAALFVIGILCRNHGLGALAFVASFVPLITGAFDLCLVSPLLGGPLSGAKIRARFEEPGSPPVGIGMQAKPEAR